MTVKVLAALALLIVVALVAPTALADDPYQPAHTHFTGQLPPPETDGAAVIQWGGGSLYQLTARLAVNGCDLNLLWVYDDQTQQYSTPYTFDGPSFLNAPFNHRYEDNIPPTTLWVKCIEMINHVYGYGLLDAYWQSHVNSLPKARPYDLSEVTDPLTDCGDHWSSAVREHVLTVLPLIQGTCVVSFAADGKVAFAVNPFGISLNLFFAYHATESTVVVTVTKASITLGPSSVRMILSKPSCMNSVT